LKSEEEQKLWRVVQEIKAELEPVIDHLLDLGHEKMADRLLYICNELLDWNDLMRLFEDKQEKVIGS